jgi:ribosomal protein S18 acetylase RimI-like enzyme
VYGERSRSSVRPPIVLRQDRPGEFVIAQIGRIYAEAFPPAQRAALETLAGAVEEGSRRLFVAQDGEEVVGFAFTVPLPETRIHCLEYLAVKRERRGQGLGSLLLRAVLADLAMEERVPGLVLEVESDRVGGQEEKTVRGARIAFYRANGAHLIEQVPHFLAPNLVDGGTLEMRLMWLPADDGPSMLNGPDLAACVRGIYSQSYGLSLTDHRIQFTLESVS